MIFIKLDNVVSDVRRIGQEKLVNPVTDIAKHDALKPKKTYQKCDIKYFSLLSFQAMI